jgi:hypothetical protein
MMKYRVTGADRNTGVDMSRVIEASSLAEAEKIASRSMLVADVEMSSSTAVATANPGECANCGNKIGRLETPQKWKGEPVCVGCYEKLAKSGRLLVRRAVKKKSSPIIVLAIVGAAVVVAGIAIFGYEEELAVALGAGIASLLLWVVVVALVIAFIVWLISTGVKTGIRRAEKEE